MSATKYVEYGDRGFWAYDIVLGVFVKHLVDVIEVTGQAHTPFLAEAIQHWRLAPIIAVGFTQRRPSLAKRAKTALWSAPLG